MNDKLVYFIIGQMGSGKTVLAKHLEKKLGNVVILEDFGFKIAKGPEEIMKLVSLIAKARHIGRKTMIITHSLRGLSKRFNFKENSIITWIFTSLNIEDFFILKEMQVDTFYLKKLHTAWINVGYKGTKTRPYLSMTLDKNKTKIKYEYHRYKNA